MTSRPKRLSSYVPLPRAWSEWRHAVSPLAEVLFVTMLLESRQSTGRLDSSVRELAELSRISPSTTSRALEELIAAGLIRRLETGTNQSRMTEYEVLFRRDAVLPQGQPLYRQRDSVGTALYAERDSVGTARHLSPAETSPQESLQERPIQESLQEAPANPVKERDRVVTLEDLEAE